MLPEKGYPETFAKPTLKLDVGADLISVPFQFIDKNENFCKSERGRYEIYPYEPSFAKVSPWFSGSILIWRIILPIGSKIINMRFFLGIELTMISRKPNVSRIHANHRNQVRIIGGEWRGRKIQFPSVVGLRPTPDSVRERLFNWLGQDLTGQTVLDVFAGSGALGFEAASRYAKQVVMCEIHHAVSGCLKQHVQQLGAGNRVHIHQQDGLQFLAQTALVFDVILLDPPFEWQGWANLLPLLRTKLAPEGYVYLEASQLPDIPIWLHVVKQGRAGRSLQLLLQMCADERAA